MAGSRNWTPEQQQVIRLRDRDILVSAAAGSGKTAVLVERILRRITDPVHPVDVDRLLVVTFTRAAAAEMRERIGDALEAQLAALQEEQTEGSPADTTEAERTALVERLMHQATLLHSAQISTIDSFCKKIVEEHFHDIDLDPVFRVADEAELLLMRADVCEKLLEEYYEENSVAFRDFAEMYATGKNDMALEEMILQLYGFAESYPDPDRWLAEQEQLYSQDTDQKRFDPVLQTLLSQMLLGAVRLNAEALAISQQADGPFAYEEALKSDKEWLAQIQTVAEAGDFDALGRELSGVSFATLSRKKQEGVPEEKKDQVKDLRDQMKKVIKELQETFFYQDATEMRADYAHTIPGVQMLLTLTAEFRRRFRERKKKNNLLDFSDLEHLALRVLRGENGEPTAAAAEYRDFYEEIMIDEYQDSNRIQEDLLTSISRQIDGQPNMFMVGDVKQSIYKFRQARPELFMEKYGSYQKAETEQEEPALQYQSQKIDLHKNFRSRAEVLDVTNQVFRQIMHRSLGGVEYDDDAALYLGASYPDLTAEEQEIMRPEILLLESEENAREEEAMMIAGRIKELRQQGFAYGEMVILLRTMSGWAETFLQTLTAEGIPAVCETASGYFSAWEVQVMLNLLRVLDNPRQDIPLASVLLSPIGGMTPEELAQIRIQTDEAEDGRTMGLYEALQMADSEKAAGFLAWLREVRHRMIYTSVHELIRMLLNETGFYRYVSAMPGGRTRADNLSMLVQRAQSFEQTSYHGLFHFVRYIEKLHKYEVDYGEADAGSGEGDVVRIMSIHKSKGLEFRAVFVSGMAKTFNQQDARSRVVLHPDLGIAVDYVDLALRQKAPTLAKKILQKQLIRDNLGEELRVLYVAFTRAREKLILTGALSGLEKKLDKWRTQVISDLSVMKAGNYLDLVMPTVLQGTRGNGVAGTPSHIFRIQLMTLTDLRLAEAVEQVEQREWMEELSQAAEAGSPDWEEIEKELSWTYRYNQWQQMKGKITVTELKYLHLQEEEAGEVRYQDEPEQMDGAIRTDGAELVSVIPEFAQTEKQMAGTTRGTLYHRIMEKLPVLRVRTEAELREYLAELQAAGQLTEEERQALNIRKLMQFLTDPLTERMRQAEQTGRLHRESPFVLGLPASGVYVDLDLTEEMAEETILVQGIIDAWFEEEDGIVLLDYKTDVVGADGEQMLIDRYRVQLEYYRKALEQLTGREVKEELIYSFGLGRSIRIPR